MTVMGIKDGFLPGADDFLNPWSMLLASIYGILGLTFIRYSEFVSTRTIKFEVFLAASALVSLTTYLFELTFAHYGLLEMRDLTTMEICGALLIMLGSANAVVIKARESRKETIK